MLRRSGRWRSSGLARQETPTVVDLESVRGAQGACCSSALRGGHVSSRDLLKLRVSKECGQEVGCVSPGVRLTALASSRTGTVSS